MKTPRFTIADSFPDLKESFHYLKTHDKHFIHILTEYEQIDNAVDRAEDELDIVEPVALETMKKERIILKDKIYNMLIDHKVNAETK